MHVRYRPPEKRKPKRERTLYSLSSPWELQVDVSFPYWRSKMICWYNAIDDCTRWVYGEIVEEYGVLESIAFIRSLLDKVPFNVHTVRTDNGKEFWKQFTEYLTSIGIIHIKNEPYMPQHNWKIERYHWTRKRLEVIFWTREMELEELRYRNNQWLFFYNYHRRHTWLAMQGLTPLKKLITSLWYNQCVSLSMQQYIILLLGNVFLSKIVVSFFSVCFLFNYFYNQVTFLFLYQHKRWKSCLLCYDFRFCCDELLLQIFRTKQVVSLIQPIFVESFLELPQLQNQLSLQHQLPLQSRIQIL